MVLFNYNGNLALKANWLWNNDITTDDNYYQLVSRKKITVLHRSAPGCPAIISYEKLPYNIKEKVDDKLKALGELQEVSLPSEEQPKEVFSSILNHIII